MREHEDDFFRKNCRKKLPFLLIVASSLNVVAETGFEPATSWL